MARLSCNTAGLPDMSRIPTIDQVGIEERVDRLKKRSIKKESKVQALKLALSMIDLTTLEGADSPGKVRQMCYKARHLHDTLPDIPHVEEVQRKLNDLLHEITDPGTRPAHHDDGA